MCEHAPNREAAMTVIDAKTWCDPCIEPLVRALNTNGLRTIASCCGHGTYPTSVILEDDRWVLVVDRATAGRIYEPLTHPAEIGPNRGN